MSYFFEGEIIEFVGQKNSRILKQFVLGYWSGSLMAFAGYVFWDRLKKGKTYKYMDEYEENTEYPLLNWYLLVGIGCLLYVVTIIDKENIDIAASTGIFFGGITAKLSTCCCPPFNNKA